MAGARSRGLTRASRRVITTQGPKARDPSHACPFDRRPPSPMPRISTGDCHLYDERHGGGFPVIFVSGLTGQASFWREQLPAVSREFEAVVFDHRGVGQSDHSRISYTIERLAADLIALMDALHIER